MIFDYENIKDSKQTMLDKIEAEYKFITISTLGGVDRASIMLSISLDKKENWAYGIFQNSRFFQFMIDRNGTVENFTSSYHFKQIRKKTVKTLREAFDYINKKINQAVVI